MIITDKGNSLNIDFDKDNQSDIRLFKDIYGVHVQIGNTFLGDTPKLEKISDYFYKIDIDDYDEDYAYSHTEPIIKSIGLCSQMRSSNFIGRNYDWYYDNKVTFLVHSKRTKNHFESYAMAQCQVTKSDVENNNYNESYKILPFQTTDGINEFGVYAAANVVPKHDYGTTTGTNIGKKDLYNVFIPRFILDNAKTAKEGVELLKNRNIKACIFDSYPTEVHCMICDDASTYIVEFVHNKMQVMSNQDDEYPDISNNLEIMTNFFEYNWNGQIKTGYLGNSKEEIDETGITKCAAGLERYKLLENAYSGIADKTDMINAMKGVWYTQTYNLETSPYWYSELCEIVPTINIYSEESKFDTIKQLAKEQFLNRSRDTAQTWQTVHTTVYDLLNKKLYVLTQEEDTEYEFDLTFGG